METEAWEDFLFDTIERDVVWPDSYCSMRTRDPLEYLDLDEDPFLITPQALVLYMEADFTRLSRRALMCN